MNREGPRELHKHDTEDKEEDGRDSKIGREEIDKEGQSIVGLGCVSNCVFLRQFESLWLERPNGKEGRHGNKIKWK